MTKKEKKNRGKKKNILKKIKIKLNLLLPWFLHFSLHPSFGLLFLFPTKHKNKIRFDASLPLPPENINQNKV